MPRGTGRIQRAHLSTDECGTIDQHESHILPSALPMIPMETKVSSNTVRLHSSPAARFMCTEQYSTSASTPQVQVDTVTEDDDADDYYSAYDDDSDYISQECDDDPPLSQFMVFY